MRAAFATILMTGLMSGFLCACASAPLEDVSLRPLPDWTDKYAASNTGDMRFFNISALMERYDLTRLQAVELQNHYRDLSRTWAGDPQQWFDEALRRVRAGEFESGLDPKALAAAPFIVVFDLDETLYDQYLKDASCHDVAYARGDGERKQFRTAPGAAKVVARIRELGGLVVLFSANVDRLTLDNLRAWHWGDRPVLGHPDVAGVLSNSYLIMQSKHEGSGKDKPRKGHPVVQPSKDLRILDPSLERVVIVDDNPRRLMQMRNARVTRKFDGDAYCRSAEGSPERRAYDRLLDTVLAEIEESVATMKAERVPFARAYLPYTALGALASEALRDANGWSVEQARRYVREHPGIVDDRY